jgi:hypothetical protein
MPDLKAAWPAGFMKLVKHLTCRIRRARHDPMAEPWLAHTTRFAGFRYWVVRILTKLFVLEIKITVPARRNLSPCPASNFLSKGRSPGWTYGLDSKEFFLLLPSIDCRVRSQGTPSKSTPGPVGTRWTTR